MENDCTSTLNRLRSLIFLPILFYLSSCGLSGTTRVPVPIVESASGGSVTFLIEESHGFFLHYRLYPAFENPITDLSDPVSPFTEEAIFRHYSHFKAYRSGVGRPRFIWQPSAGDIRPFLITLDIVTGDFTVANGNGIIIFSSSLVRVNLDQFSNFRNGDQDVPSNFTGLNGSLAWAAMNTLLDTQRMTLLISAPVYLHHANITITS